MGVGFLLIMGGYGKPRAGQLPSLAVDCSLALPHLHSGSATTNPCTASREVKCLVLLWPPITAETVATPFVPTQSAALASVCACLSVLMVRRSTMSELRYFSTQPTVLAGGFHFNRFNLCRARNLGVGCPGIYPQVWRTDGDDCDVDGILELRAECLVHNHSCSATDVDQHWAVWWRKFLLVGVARYMCCVASRPLVHWYVHALRLFRLIARCVCKVLNTASGSFLAKNCDDSNRGLYSGIFMAFNQGSSLPGNLLSICFSFAPSSTPTGGSASGADGLEDDHDPHCESTRPVASIPIFVEQLSGALATPGGPDTTWRDRVILGWAGQTSIFFIALAAMCLAGTGALCTIQPPPASHVQGETDTVSKRHSSLGMFPALVKTL